MATAAQAPPIINVRLPDGRIVQWNPTTEPKPDSVGNGSRNGFLYNCYYHPLGRFFQNTIKHGITAVLSRLHDKEIPRYDRQAYTFDDPRLQNLARILKGSVGEHVADQDCARKQELFEQAIDIVLFLAKEDVFYRGRMFAILQDLGRNVAEHPENYHLTMAEAFNYYRFPLNFAGLQSIGYPLQKLVDDKIITQDRLDAFLASQAQQPATSEEGAATA